MARSLQFERKIEIPFLIGSIALLAVEFFVPLSGDNIVYQSMAKEWLRYGSLPYLGTWDQNFPGIIYLHAVSILLFGDSEIGFHIFDFVFHVLAALIFYRLLCRWLPSLWAILAVLLYNISYASGAGGQIGERDAFVAGILIAIDLRHFTRSF